MDGLLLQLCRRLSWNTRTFTRGLQKFSGRGDLSFKLYQSNPTEPLMACSLVGCSCEMGHLTFLSASPIHTCSPAQVCSTFPSACCPPCGRADLNFCCKGLLEEVHKVPPLPRFLYNLLSCSSSDVILVRFACNRLCPCSPLPGLCVVTYQ